MASSTINAGDLVSSGAGVEGTGRVTGVLEKGALVDARVVLIVPLALAYFSIGGGAHFISFGSALVALLLPVVETRAASCIAFYYKSILPPSRHFRAKGLAMWPVGQEL